MPSSASFRLAGRSSWRPAGLPQSGGLEPAPRRDRRGREADAGTRACCPAGARRSRHSGQDPDRSGREALELRVSGQGRPFGGPIAD
jgi:hypothetical protein